jgi:hypothetical protein
LAFSYLTWGYLWTKFHRNPWCRLRTCSADWVVSIVQWLLGRCISRERSRGNKLISSTRNQVEIKEIMRNQGNHEKSRKSREIKEIKRNQGNHKKSRKSTEITRNQQKSRKSTEIIRNHYYNIYINLLELFDVVSKIAKILQFYLFFVDLVTRRMMYER